VHSCRLGVNPELDPQTHCEGMRHKESWPQDSTPRF
jgi:hypothetical protein